MRLTFLGTGGYHPSERRHTACVMLPEAGVVLDAGSGFFRVQERVQTDELDVFLTHAHLDHVVGRLLLVHTDPQTCVDDPVGVEGMRKLFPNIEMAEDLQELHF